ncbi:hypothetical protein CA267_001885 [Alteromonas pelagimontana]|uniref:Uncharacterized protein n=1 Tax=Alteromonas pelagimontana TaxID=1858656 RepID=A0A6M4M8W3_9ALTE|nr:hypothetical protein [Alteromonas pelagimontana]QJR79634.1 hypothetical protein CA267_001885 [Alteromonas pelagimontana]
MSDLQQEVAKLIEKANNGIDSAGSFLQAELPEYINQLLLWHSIHSLVLAVIGMALMASPILILRKTRSLMPKPPQNREETSWAYEWWSFDKAPELNHLGVMVWISSGLLSLCMLCVGAGLINLDWLQIWLAPKVWLVEYAAKLTS